MFLSITSSAYNGGLYYIFYDICNTMQHEKYAILLHAVQFFKVLINFFILPDGFRVNCISVYGFHNIVAGPSSPLQNILVWYPYGVHNGFMSTSFPFFSDIRSITNAGISTSRVLSSVLGCLMYH